MIAGDRPEGVAELLLGRVADGTLVCKRARNERSFGGVGDVSEESREKDPVRSRRVLEH